MINKRARFEDIFNSSINVPTFTELTFAQDCANQYDLSPDKDNEIDPILKNRDYCGKLYAELVSMDKISQFLFIQYHLQRVHDKMYWLRDLSAFVNVFMYTYGLSSEASLPNSLKHVPDIIDKFFEDLIRNSAIAQQKVSLKLNLSVNEFGYFLRKLTDIGVIEPMNRKAMFEAISQIVQTKGAGGSISEKKLSNSFYEEPDLKTIEKVQTIFAQCMQLCIKDK